MLESLLQSWRSLARREQRMVMAAAVVVVIAVIYLVAFEPAWKGSRRIAGDLPALRAQVSQMDGLAEEARRLASTPKVNETPQTLRRQLEGSAQAAGLHSYISQVSLSGQSIDIRFKEVPFAAWSQWMAGALRETRLRVIDAQIVREAKLGTVSVRMTLEGPAREGGS